VWASGLQMCVDLYFGPPRRCWWIYFLCIRFNMLTWGQTCRGVCGLVVCKCVWIIVLVALVGARCILVRHAVVGGFIFSVFVSNTNMGTNFAARCVWASVWQMCLFNHKTKTEWFSLSACSRICRRARSGGSSTTRITSSHPAQCPTSTTHPTPCAGHPRFWQD